MNQFNFNRFIQVLKYLFILRRKKIYTLFFAILAITVIFSILRVGIFHWEYIDEAMLTLKLNGVAIFIAYVCLLILSILGSMIISDLDMKQSRIRELMLPATMLEKFFARLLLVSLGTFIVVFAAFFTGDIIQYLYTYVVNGGKALFLTSLLLESIKAIEIFKKEIPIVYIVVTICSFLVHGWSIQVLGGMVFRKTAWLKTIFATNIISVILMFIGVSSLNFIDKYTDYEFYIPSKEQVFYTINIIFNVLTIVYICLSYHIYRRLQPRNTGWFNI